MLVYGDDEEVVSPRRLLDEAGEAAASLRATGRGLAWHASAVEILIELAALAQGVADREADLAGHDEASPAQDRLHAALLGIARTVDRSWRSRFQDQPSRPAGLLGALDDLPLPSTITRKRCEGYAFYGLYPETYLEAARGLGPGVVVIGIRSIGSGLAALVAAASGSKTILTIRPRGHPFSRTVAAGPELERRIRSEAGCRFVIADEGPGLSGSSFGGVADWLESLGVARERIVFMPSHEGGPGPQASAAHRQRWAVAEKRVCSFEQLFASPASPMPLWHWFGDITGPLREAPEDLSAGRWARERADIPTAPSREARKYLLHGRDGSFIAKYAGLDRAAHAKFERATRLHAAGFCARPLALRYGFIIEPLIEGGTAQDLPGSHIAAYLRFRRDSFPARRRGASLVALAAMARHNIGQADPEAAAASAARWTEERVTALEAVAEPVHVDARLHRWEWLRSGGRILKTDALDHAQAHDLVGCQDILWDVAGATVELPGPDEAAREVAEPFVAGVARRRELLDLLTLCYLGFQIGWWRLSGTAPGEARSRFYQAEAAQALARQA